MSIGKRILEALDAYAAGNIEGAVISACVALDATASRRYPKMKVGARYRAFVDENLPVITRMMFERAIVTESLRFAYQHPEIKLDANGLCSFSDIVYVAIRCALLHDARLPSNFILTDQGTVELNAQGDLEFPQELALGLIFAVVCEPLNSAERLPARKILNMHGHSCDVDDFWGNRAKLMAFCEKR